MPTQPKLESGSFICYIAFIMQTVGFSLFGIILVLLLALFVIAIVGAIVYFGFIRKKPASTPISHTIQPPRQQQHQQPVKRCPQCGSTYTDQTLSFCLSDGSPLEIEGDGEYE